MVREARTIIVGRFSVDGENVRFDVEETIKDTSPTPSPLTVDAALQVMGFTVRDAALKRGRERVLLLGSRDDRRLYLTWLYASIWPPEIGVRTFPSQSFAACRAFVDDILGYHATGQRDRSALVETLLTDVSGPRIYAVLDFVWVSLGRYLAASERTVAAQIAWSALADILARDRVDEYLGQELINILPILPPTLAVPWLLASNQPHAPVLVQRIFRRCGMLSDDRPLTTESATALYSAHARALRARDVDFALAMLDSLYAPLRTCLGDLVLAQLLGAPLEALIAETPPDDPRRRKELWRACAGS